MCTLAQQQQYMCTLAQQNPWQKTWPQPRPFIIRLQTHPRTHIRWDCSANPCVCKTCVRIIQQGLYLRYKQIQGLAQTWAEWPHRPSKVLHRHGRNVLTDHPKSCTNMVEMSPQTIQSLAQTWSECPRRLPAKFHAPKCLHALTPPQRPVKLFRNCLQNIERCFYFSNHRLECVATFFKIYFYFYFLLCDCGGCVKSLTDDLDRLRSWPRNQYFRMWVLCCRLWMPLVPFKHSGLCQCLFHLIWRCVTKYSLRGKGTIVLNQRRHPRLWYKECSKVRSRLTVV